ncbi:MAG: hypothetical protein H8E44_09385 [Planctomycetes bacterium]|nr:hypothetical protein [Planctomycetota bacterium]MBL7041730.1 hypothetical protein [Pirellulaceae bacterium]
MILRPNGLLADPLRPWETADNAEAFESAMGLAVSRLVLEKFHEKLFSFYDQIDVERVLCTAEPESNAELDEEIAAATCRRLAEQPDTCDGESEPREGIPRRRIKPLRLLSVLEARLECEVEQGKCSEITVLSQGWKEVQGNAKTVFGGQTWFSVFVASCDLGRAIRRR